MALLTGNLYSINEEGNSDRLQSWAFNYGDDE